MHRAHVSGRRTAVVVEEPDATSTYSAVGVPDDRDDEFAPDDGVDEATTTTMIYVKKENKTMDDDDGDDDDSSSSNLLQLQQQQRQDVTEIEDVSTRYTR